jgi:hypothetical protein
MALIIADRVKETTITQGTGTISLSGATFGGFQSFSDAIGEGNTTYYCIQNESNFEIGIGTFSSGNLSRDTVIKSSNSDNKISIVGVAVVFGVVPSSKLIYKDADGNFVISGDVNVDDVNADLVSANSGDFGSILTNGATSSGLLTLKRTDAGNFIHAYVDDANDRTIGLYSDANTSPTWRLGLKTSPSDPTAAPNYGYFYATEGAGGLIGDADNQITIANSAPFIVKHQGVDVVTAHYSTGVHLQSNSSSYPAFVVNGGAALSADIQRWNNNAGTTLSVVDNAGNLGVKNSNPSYQLDVTGTGNFSQSIRFGDGTVQSTAYVNSSGELQSQITTNAAASGSLQSQITSNTAVSGSLQPQITVNAAVSGVLQSQISNIESTSVISGVLQPQITTNAAVSGSLQPQITTNNTRASGLIASVSGALQHPVTLNSNLSGVLQPQITTNDTRASGLIASVSGALQHPVTLNSNLSGVLQPQIITNDTRASGLIQSTIDSMSGIIVKEADGSPNVSNVNTIVVSNGTLTDNSNGQVTITTGGGGGSSHTAGSGLTLVGDEFNFTAVVAAAATHVPVTVRGASAQSANLQEWQDSSEVVLANISADGSIATSGDISTSGQVFLPGGGGTSVPTLCFTGSSNRRVGFYEKFSDQQIAFCAGGRNRLIMGDDRLQVGNASYIGWSSSDVGEAQDGTDTNFKRYSAGIIAAHGSSLTDDRAKLGQILASGLTASGVELVNHVPASTTNRLYNDGGTLKFNGSAVGGGGGGSSADILANSASGVAISGALQPQITTNDTRASGLIASVSGALQHPVTLNSNLSGVLQPQITTNDTRASGLIASVSGALQHPVTLNSNLSGVLQPQITTNDTRASGLIASVSGALQHPVTLNSNLSGVLQPQITNNDTRASGLIDSVSGALQPQITSATLTAGSGITIDSLNKINVYGGSGQFIDLTVENPGDTTNDITGNALIVNSNNTDSDARIAFFTNKNTYHATDHHALQIRGNTTFNGADGASLVARRGDDVAYAPLHLRGGGSSDGYINGISIQENFVKIIGPTLFYDNLGSRNANTIVNIVRGAAAQAANLHEWQNSSEVVLANVSADGSIATSGTISASGGLLLNDLVPNSTTNALYNDGGTLKFNGSAVGGGAVSAVANGVDNRVVTFSSADALNGEANLTFDGSTLAVNGAFTATTKSFLIDHPTKEGMKLQYASLEGPENGVYIRGTSGSNIITLPDYWADLVDESTVTVSLTPIGSYQALYIEEKGNNYIKVGGSKGSYDYVVYGERKDVEKLKVEW